MEKPSFTNLLVVAQDRTIIIVFLAKGVYNPMTNVSLRVQLTWFKQSLPSLCGDTRDCKHLIGSSLILMGEIGGNDYNGPFFSGKSIDEVKSYVPLVIDTIISAINELIEMEGSKQSCSGNFSHEIATAYLKLFGYRRRNMIPHNGLPLAP
ncbi:hypothetical protein Tco_0758137 [Tanacetum coccineum]